MLQVHGTRATHVSPLCASLRTPTWSSLSNSVLCGTGLWAAIAFDPRWTSLDDLTSMGEVFADYNEQPLCAPDKSTEQDSQRPSRAGSSKRGDMPCHMGRRCISKDWCAAELPKVMRMA